MTEEMERPRSGLSMASSITTTASVSQGSRPSTRSVKRVHTFGKREYSIKRDPNSPVVIRGWLYKQDSAGLRLWKRRWFVLSDFCLFYYRDSREETVLGSILLPSYEILPANPREVKNRRFSFKAEHPGMRTYYFGADTQEDMNAWIRAMNQSALVVGNNKNKSSHGHNLTSQDELYASYEDFSHSEINTAGDDGKSAESLEIAHLSETRSQDESSRDSLPDQDRNGDLEKDRLFSGLRESLTDAMQHYTSVSQNGSVPPPTPESGVKQLEFTYNRPEVESKMSAEGKDSIPEDEEWVPFQKCLSVPYQDKSPPSPPKSFECPLDEYSSTLSRSAPSSPAVVPTHVYRADLLERNWNFKDEKFKAQTEFMETPDGRKMSPLSCSPSRTTTCSSPERVEYVVQRIIKASRSQSLPPTPSEVSRHRIIKKSPPPNLKYGSPLPCEKPLRYPESSQANVVLPVGSPPKRDLPLTPSLSPKVHTQQHKTASNEDVFVAVTGSPSLGRITVRSNTPIGRVDILPSEDRAPNSATIRHSEERPGDYFVTSSRTRSHIAKSASRPQTPSDRYDVLPSDDSFTASTMAKGPNRYPRRSQPLGAEEERLDGSGINLPPRSHGYPSNRMQIRPNTSSERVIIEDYPAELSLTPSLRRHRGQGPRYSERSFLPPAVCSGRGLGNTPRHLSKMGSVSYSQLPPLPPGSNRPHLPAGKRMSLSAVQSGTPQYRDRAPYPARMGENSIDILLTKMCGQDRLLTGIEEESAHLRAEKEKLEDALQLTHQHLDEFQGQEQVIENIWYQQRLLQDDLVYVRARLCDLSLDRDRAWEEYRILENELHAMRETLERVSQIGHPQDQAAAQRDLWMINDIISGLRFNKTNFHIIPDPARHPAMMMPPPPASETPANLPRSFLYHQSGLNPFNQDKSPIESEAIPPRPPLPKDNQSSNNELEGLTRGAVSEQNEQDRVSEEPGTTAAPQSQSTSSDAAFPIKDVVRPVHSSCPVPIPSGHKVTLEPKASPPNVPEMGTVRKQRMSAEEQMERMRRHQEAQIHEKPKPGVTAQRQNSQRSATGPIGGRLRSSSSDSSTSSQPVDKTPTEQRKAKLVRVTASFYPSNTSAPLHGKTGSVNARRSSPDAMPEDPTYSVVMEPQTENVTSVTSHEISPLVKVTPPLRTSSKIVTAACMQLKKDMHNGSYNKQGREETSATMKMLPKEVEGMPKTGDRLKTTSPDERYTISKEGERERMVSLSYTLASEASELGKIITAKALADECDTSSDVSTSDEVYPWDFLRDSQSNKQREVRDHCQTTSTSLHQKEKNYTKNDEPHQHCSEEASSPDRTKDQVINRHSDNLLHYENWTAQKQGDSREHGPVTKQDSPALPKCNGQVASYDFLIEDLHYNPLSMSKVTDFCKEEREPIRITLLQSSF
ncbi:pleckstrin homology domain-containing family A member 7-like isoform X1 [Bufo gargarizans]|uniref:pleckstrin homology domain-containing family A member 7-like isoform X1 n=1 Tax=Bufo gargarizans TaxID=30331 RepID=UPI001CF40654|nr:pleckstrin homology domain-containing family A member 7-like isoform X1 [Bufo gargarizans]XP_044137470.1 pleckstrin homology domain-containing family A member 7-like isoform X1 [Bufo gargarizans]